MTVAALTIYDLCKAVDKAMAVSELRLLKKTKKTFSLPASQQEPDGSSNIMRVRAAFRGV